MPSGTFYFSGYTVNNGDWTDPQDDYRWQDGTKTLFDPCPPGWKVPKSGTGIRSLWSAFTAENGTWNGANAQSGGGYHYNTVSTSGTPWYPASGFYLPSAGFSGTGQWIHSWSSSVQDSASYSFRVSYTAFTPNTPNVRNHGFSVRCIRE